MRAWGDSRPYVRQTTKKGVRGFEAMSSLPKPPDTAMDDTIAREGKLIKVSLSSEDESVADKGTPEEVLVSSSSDESVADKETAVADVEDARETAVAEVETMRSAAAEPEGQSERRNMLRRKYQILRGKLIECMERREREREAEESGDARYATPGTAVAEVEQRMKWPGRAMRMMSRRGRRRRRRITAVAEAAQKAMEAKAKSMKTKNGITAVAEAAKKAMIEKKAMKAAVLEAAKEALKAQWKEKTKRGITAVAEAAKEALKAMRRNPTDMLLGSGRL